MVFISMEHLTSGNLKWWNLCSLWIIITYNIFNLTEIKKKLFIKLRFFRKYLTFENHTNRLWNTHDNFVPPAVCARILKLVTSSYKVNSYIIFRKFLSYWFSCSLFGFDAIFLHEKLYSKYNIFFLLFQFPYIFGM